MPSNRRPTASLFVVATAIATLGVTPFANAATVTLQSGTATCSQNNASGNFSVDEAIDTIVNGTDGWAIFCGLEDAVAETAVFETATDLTGPNLLVFVLQQQYDNVQHTLGRFRLSVTSASRANFADGADNGGDLGMAAIWTVLDPVFALSTGGATLTEQGDHSILASGASPNQAAYKIYARTSQTITGIRLEVLEDASLPDSGPGRFENGNFVLSELTLDASACPGARIDVDGDGFIKPLTDTLLMLRYAFGFSSGTLINGATDPQCTRCTAGEIEAYLSCLFL